MNAQCVTDAPAKGNCDDPVYDAFLERINKRFQAISSPMFTTNAAGLFQTYLGEFSGLERQYHNCHACQHFIEKFGGLVTIDESGNSKSAIWDCADAPDFYQDAVAAMESVVRKAKVTGVFLSSEKTWGQQETGVWKHFYVQPNRVSVHSKRTQTAGQAMAEKREDFKNVITALGEFDLPVVEQALRLLKSEALYRNEKVLGPVQWLHDLHVARTKAKGPEKANILWRAVALAPAGFCHPRSSMAGTLLEDIAVGMDFNAISKRFAEKMHPLQYLRPQAAPKIGNIEQAEKVVEQMGIAASLERRFARIDEIDALWKPTPKQLSTPKGVFGHLKEKQATPLRVPSITVTWVKFERTVLATAREVEVFIPGTGDFIALVTAANEDAPPIIQWDLPERRNPVSWYRYHGGSTASQWNLQRNTWAAVTAACLYPGAWFGAKSNHSNEAVFILQGAVDSQNKSSALFPEILKSELHQVRSVIEAYSKSRTLSGAANASACGICAVGAHVRVDNIEYKIDRWE